MTRRNADAAPRPGPKYKTEAEFVHRGRRTPPRPRKPVKTTFKDTKESLN